MIPNTAALPAHKHCSPSPNVVLACHAYFEVAPDGRKVPLTYMLSVTPTARPDPQAVFNRLTNPATITTSSHFQLREQLRVLGRKGHGSQYAFCAAPTLPF